MDVNSVEKEIADSVRGILKSKGVDGSQIKIDTRAKTSSVKMPVNAQGVNEGREVVEWRKATVTTAKIKLSIKFVVPERS